MPERSEEQRKCRSVGVSCTTLFDLILVEWVDSLQPVTGWHMTDDLPVLEAAKCKTVGWLVADNNDAIMIAQNIADPESTQMQAGGLMRIPKCCIISSSVLSSRLVQERTRPESEPGRVSASSLQREPWKPVWIYGVMFVSLAWCVGVGKRLIDLSNVPDDQSLLASGTGDAGDSASQGRESK